MQVLTHKMTSKTPCQSLSPQRLYVMLEDCQSRQDETWKKSLLSYSANQDSEIGPKDRDIAVAWLSHLNTRFNFYPETFFLAVYNLDRFLTVVKSHPKYLKCIACTCLYVASKLIEEEEHVPGTKELVEISQSGCRPQDILRMERIILVKLGWNLHIPTALTYLEIFYFLALSNSPLWNARKLANSKENLTSVADHLNQLTLELQRAMCDYAIAPFPSCAVALALISLRIEVLSNEFQYWTAVTSKIQNLAKIKTGDFMQCRNILQSILPLKRYCASSGNTVYIVSAPAQNFDSTPTGQEPKQPPSAQQLGPVKRKANELSSNVVTSDGIKKFHLNASDDDENADMDDVIKLSSSGSVMHTETSDYCTVKFDSNSSEPLEDNIKEHSCPPLTKISDLSPDKSPEYDVERTISGDISPCVDMQKYINGLAPRKHSRSLTYAEIVKFGLMESAMMQ